jgi:hypothetical protein
VVGRVWSPAKGRHPFHGAPANRPGSIDGPIGLLPCEIRFGWVPPVIPEHGGDNGDRITVSAAIDDVWCVLARARTDGAARTLAAARDAVFRRYLPMALALVDGRGGGSRSVDSAAAERAAELGLAQAVLGWRRSDGRGFEVVARTAIAARLRRLPTPG